MPALVDPSANFDKVRDAASYDRLAGAYHKYIEKLSEPLAQRAVALARLELGHRVLDVGTGGGIASRYAAHKVGPEGSVLGIDLSEGMLKVAAEASQQQAITNIAFRRMDAERLDFPDESFDAVMSLCAVSHFPNISTALAQMIRVTRRGHRLVVATGYGRPPLGYGLFGYAVKRGLYRLSGFAKPQRWAPHVILDFMARRVPELAEPEETDWQKGDPTGQLVAHVRAAGLREIASCWHGHILTFESAADYWEAQTAIVTRVRKRLLALSPDRVAQLREEFLSEGGRILASGGKLYYPYGAFYVTGIRA